MMNLRYVLKNNENIKILTREIDQLKRKFNELPSIPYQEEQLRRLSLLKSSVFSARIEGNPLTLEQVETLPARRQKTLRKQEIFNLFSAYKHLYSKSSPNKLSRILVAKLHQIVMRHLTLNPGKLRDEPGAIFNQAGVAIYHAPPPQDLPVLVTEYISLINTLPHHPTINAAIAHFLFEKIHPFLDGNGRVGRLIAAHILNRHTYSFRGLLALEEYIEHHKDHYYESLEPNQQVNQFVEFFLESVKEQGKQAIERLQQLASAKPEDKLLPRRREILSIIRDHPYCSFDSLARRFPTVNPKTLHYDLGQLQKQNFIVKVGISRGATYKAVSHSA